MKLIFELTPPITDDEAALAHRLIDAAKAETLPPLPPPPPPPSPPPPPAISPDGSTLLAGGQGSLVTGEGTWTFSTGSNEFGNFILLNGQPAADGAANELEVANGGQMYAKNPSNWYKWNGLDWDKTSDLNAVSPPSPPPPSPPPSTATLSVTVTPVDHPEYPPPGTVVGRVTVTVSDGSLFTGSIGFDGAQLSGGNDNGVYAMVNFPDPNTGEVIGEIIVNPDGPGVGTVAELDRLFVKAVQ
jgi:hypothetical protein